MTGPAGLRSHVIVPFLVIQHLRLWVAHLPFSVYSRIFALLRTFFPELCRGLSFPLPLPCLLPLLPSPFSSPSIPPPPSSSFLVFGVEPTASPSLPSPLILEELLPHHHPHLIGPFTNLHRILSPSAIEFKPMSLTVWFVAPASEKNKHRQLILPLVFSVVPPHKAGSGVSHSLRCCAFMG